MLSLFSIYSNFKLIHKTDTRIYNMYKIINYTLMETHMDKFVSPGLKLKHRDDGFANF